MKVAHFRLAYSRQMFVIAYLRESLEMVLDAHVQAFTFLGGVPARMIYDNLKTVVDAICVGQQRNFNRRFLSLANHYLFEPVACTPASGWEKGQVENQVGNIRAWLFTPLARFETLAALNTWLAMRCTERAQSMHPSQPGRRIAESFAEEQRLLRPVSACFDGYVEQVMRASSTCLVRIDRNRYSVPADFAGQVVSVRITAQNIKIVAQDKEIACHERHFGRDQLICDPWHDLPILEKKPGALRNGAPFVNWALPEPIQHVRQHLLKQPAGDRAFVEWRMVAREAGRDTLTVACERALEYRLITAPVILNEMRRLLAPARSTPLQRPHEIKLHIEPHSECNRYDDLRGVRYVH